MWEGGGAGSTMGRTRNPVQGARAPTRRPAAGGGRMISANTGFLWSDRPFLERIRLAGRHGFDAVEFHDEAQRESVADVRAVLAEAGVALLGLNTDMGEGGAGVPGREAEARAAIEHAVRTVRALGGTAVHVLAGRAQESERAWATYRDNLAHACDRAEGLTILIEPLSTVPDYLLSDLDRARSVIEWVGRPNLKIMFDVFHVASARGDDAIVEAYRAHAPAIGHVQVAHPRSRHEPDPALVLALREAGHRGAIGAEYVPETSVEAGLGWMDAVRAG